MGQIAPSKLISARLWRVGVEHAVETTGDSGAPITEWQPLTLLFLSRETILASERLVSGQVLALEQTRWTGPYDVRLDPDLVDVPKTIRLTVGTRTFDITRARRVGSQGAMLELVTTQSTAVDTETAAVATKRAARDAHEAQIGRLVGLWMEAERRHQRDDA